MNHTSCQTLLDPNLPAVPARQPELLAPAGDLEAMRAAVANGADAVYFGLADFNARHRATNFTLEELPATMQYLHEHGVRGYVAFNTLIFSDELPLALDYLAGIVQAGADAVIVQDLGLVRLIRRLAPQFSVHGSTQMTLTEPRGIEFVRSLGVERVILARELSLKEIERIAGQTSVPLEVFVHGALCVAYSGQCLTSESLGGRSANRGQCAQACRQPYELIVDGQVRDLGDQAYLLSPQDLAAYDLIGDLHEIGVCSLKIEGRLKSAHYVAATTQTYRAAIDAAVASRPFSLTQQQELDLAQSFSRGFTHGFLSGVNHQQLVHGRFPKNRGVRLGRVVETTPRGVVVELDRQFAGQHPRDLVREMPLKPGDGVVFDEGHPEQDEQGGRVYSVELYCRNAGASKNTGPSTRTARPERRQQQPRHPPAPPQSAPVESTLVEITFGRGAVNLAAVSRGSTLWKTDDPALRRRLERTFSGDAPGRPSPISIHVHGEAGSLLRITVYDNAASNGTAFNPTGARATVTVTWDQPLQSAQKHPLTVELVREQFGRLGGTPFTLAAIELRTAAGPVKALPVMVPKSVLNDLRRRAVQALIERRQAVAHQGDLNLRALEDIRREIGANDVQRNAVQENAVRDRAGLPGVAVLVRNVEQLEAVLSWTPPSSVLRPEMVYCDFEEVRLFKQAVARCRAAGMPVGVATPRVVKPAEQGLLLQIANCRPDAVLVRNLTAVSFFNEKTSGLRLIGDYALNVANEITASIFGEQGLERLAPSYDLNLQQLEAMLKRIDPGLFELVLHQHMPMFHMEHCVFSHTLSNGRDFHDCGRPCDLHRVELRDHVGEAHPLVADVGCRNTVFNAHAQSAAAFYPRLRAWGIRHFRIELLRESAAETHALLDSYAGVLAGSGAGPRVWRELQVLNQLGVTSGTLTFE